MSFFSKFVDDFKKGFNKDNEGKDLKEESSEISLGDGVPSTDTPPLEDSLPLEPSEQLPALRPTGEVATTTGENAPKSVWSTFVTGTKDVFNKVAETVGNTYTEWTDKLTPNEIASAKILGTPPVAYREYPLKHHPVDAFGDGECQAFIVRMGEYFRKRPRFKLDEAMLNSMEVLFSERHIVNHINVSVLFENRTFSCGCKAYEGESIPNRASVDQSNIDPWNIEFEPHQTYKNRQSTILVFDSLWTDQCKGCNGRRMYTCGTCHGQGEYRCDSCAGRGENRCSSCHGTGAHCGLGPERNSDGRCRICSGGGWERCFYCGGSGIRRCIYCGGNGKIACSDCKGSGSQLFYIDVTQTLKGASKAAFIRNAHVPLNVLKKLKQKKDIHEAARLETNSLASEGVRQWLADHFSDGNEFIIQELGKWFDEFRRSVGKDDSINVHRLEMIVSQTVVNHVQYALGNEHYDIWLYGQGQKPLEAMNPLKR